jgi:hypothetical protein
MEIRVEVDDEFAKNLQDKLGTKKATDIARAALTLLNWAVDEVSQGRVILSRDRDGNDLHRLAMPILDTVKTLRGKVVGRAMSSGTITPRLVSEEIRSEDFLKK